MRRVKNVNQFTPETMGGSKQSTARSATCAHGPRRSALHRDHRIRAISTPGLPVLDPRSWSKLSLRAHRRSAKGAEFAVDVDAHGWPAIVTVAVLTTAVILALLLWSWFQ
jgi:hypothetical protein